MSQLLDADAARLADCAKNEQEPIKTLAPFVAEDFEPLSEADRKLAEQFAGGLVLDVDAIRRAGL